MTSSVLNLQTIFVFPNTFKDLPLKAKLAGTSDSFSTFLILNYFISGLIGGALSVLAIMRFKLRYKKVLLGMNILQLLTFVGYALILQLKATKLRYLVAILVSLNGFATISTMSIIYHYYIQICSPLKLDPSTVTGAINLLWNILAAINLIAIQGSTLVIVIPAEAMSTIKRMMISYLTTSFVSLVILIYYNLMYKKSF